MNVSQWNQTVARCWEGRVGQPGEEAGHELVCEPARASFGNAKQRGVEWWGALMCQG